MDDVKALQQFVLDYQRCVNAGDLDGCAELYSEDIVWMAPNMPDRIGRRELLSEQGAVFRKYHFELKLTPTEISVLDERWGFLICSGQGRLIPKEEGHAVEISFRHMYLLSKQSDGRWRISRHIDFEQHVS
jgi:uncharacterized protein (TIGR02246 family)